MEKPHKYKMEYYDYFQVKEYIAEKYNLGDLDEFWHVLCQNNIVEGNGCYASIPFGRIYHQAIDCDVIDTARAFIKEGFHADDIFRFVW